MSGAEPEAETAPHIRRVVVQHDNGLRQICGVWPSDRNMPMLQIVQDTAGTVRQVRLAEVTDRLALYVMVPLESAKTPPTA